MLAGQTLQNLPQKFEIKTHNVWNAIGHVPLCGREQPGLPGVDIQALATLPDALEVPCAVVPDQQGEEEARQPSLEKRQRPAQDEGPQRGKVRGRGHPSEAHMQEVTSGRQDAKVGSEREPEQRPEGPRVLHLVALGPVLALGRRHG